MSSTVHHPELLDEQAERARSSGADELAHSLEKCATQWRSDLAALHDVQVENTRLQRQINEAQRTLRPAA